MPMTVDSFQLTPGQLEFFDREGYLVVEDLFDDRVLQDVIDELTREIDTRARDLAARGKLSQAFEGEDFEHRLARISAETDELSAGIWDGQLASPAIFNLIRYGPLLDVAEQLCGPELIASSVYRLRPKVPNNVRSAVPWHQDSGYFEPYCDHSLVLTVWLPLVDATEENGCLWVKPRSHKGEVVTHTWREGKPYLFIPDDALPAVDAVCVPVRKGGALLLTNRTPHASFDNDTDRVRWSMDLRYQSAALPTNAPISRLPGESVPSERIPGACYPPEADFLVRSRLRPDEVLTDPAAFNRMRKSHQFKPVTKRWTPVS